MGQHRKISGYEMSTGESKLKAVLREFSSALQKRYGDRYVRLWLYGSQARGDAHSESDVDLLLVLRDVTHPTREIDRISDILADFNLHHNVLLSVLPVDEKVLKDSNGPFWRNVRHEGIAA